MDIPEEFLWCRDVMHSWDPYTASISRNKQARRREVQQVLRCVRCHTLKTRTMTTGGELLRSSYSYPNGYLLTEQGRLTPSDREWIRQHNLQAAFKNVEETA